MADKTDDSLEVFKKLLDKEYQWPAVYPFRFIMPLTSVEDFSKLFPNEKLESRFSKNAKYVAIHFDMEMQSSQAVLDVYAKIKNVDGVMSL